MKRLGRLPALLMTWMILTGLHFWVIAHLGNGPAIDPDRFFHLAVSKMTAENGLIRSIPQAEDIGWGAYFPEKEFLFHVLTGLAYHLGGENGVLLVVPGLGAMLFLLLLWSAGPTASLLRSGLMVSTVIVLDGTFYTRLFLLRPHLLAIVCCIFLLGSLLRRNAILASLAGFLFSLSYHGIHTPLAVLGIAAALTLLTGAQWGKAVAAGVVGLAFGTLVNPYFPSNLSMAWHTMKMASNMDLNSRLDSGMELFPFPLFDYLRYYSFHFLIIAFAVALVARVVTATTTSRPSLAIVFRNEKMQNLLLLLLSAAFFLTLTAVTRRAVEYATPIAAILAAAVATFQSERRLGLILALGGVLLLASVDLQFYRRIWAARDAKDHPARVIEALASLPVEAAGRKIFNCAWEDGSMILYRRPEMRFIDLLAPTFILDESPEKTWLRHAMNHGALAVPWELASGVFKADYLLCNNPQVIAQLEVDPQFKRVYPPASEAVNLAEDIPLIYRVAPLASSALLIESEVEVAPETAAGVWSILPGQSALLNLKAPGNSTACAAYRPTEAALKKHAGARYLAFGGYDRLSVSLGGRPLGSKIGPFAQVRSVHTFFHLPHALGGGEKLEVTSCPVPSAPYQGFTFSIWTEEQLAQACREKSWTGALVKKGETCLGPVLEP